MTISLPFLTAYDPPGTSEGTLDPMGLYQIADQLAMILVPAVRERMQRIRFLTAMAVGSMVTEGMEGNPRHRDADPYLVWEWLVTEALLRTFPRGESMWGVPGTLVTRRAIDNHGYLDSRSYLKSPRIFGFFGVYKRLAIHVGIVDVHLNPGPNAESLAEAWARGLGMSGLKEASPLLDRWSSAVGNSLNESPPRCRPQWRSEGWTELANAFAPWTAKAREKRFLQELLIAGEDRRLGALPDLWRLQPDITDDDFREEELHDRLEEIEPKYSPLLRAIRAYEGFSRSIQDAFDILKAEAAREDAKGFLVTDISRDKDFQLCVKDLHLRYAEVDQTLSEITVTGLSLKNLFSGRFGIFAEPMDAGQCALALCVLHEAVQDKKSEEGKRYWFDCIGQGRIYIRHAYREARRDTQPGKYFHSYRGNPIRRFWRDLV